MSESAINAPKGLLRLLILDITSKSPASGAEIIKHIQQISDSMWSPSPGSIYPILKNLQKNEYLTEIYSTDSNQKKYGATTKGKSILLIEKEKLKKDWVNNIYYIKIMAELLNLTQDELFKIVKSHL
tara:strand:+ start:19943 stop:20323 length:381 start_codon:yes stop_codon:yes gene_type:complete